MLQRWLESGRPGPPRWEGGGDEYGRSDYAGGGSEMTLIYALIAEGGVVLAADSQSTYTHSGPAGVVATYESEVSKIQIVGRYAIGVSGNGGMADTLLADCRRVPADKGFDHFALGVQAVLRGKYESHGWSNVPVAFTLCGVDDGRPQAVKLDRASAFDWNPICDRGFLFSGAEKHGGVLYLHHRLYNHAGGNLSVNRAEFLAYCVVKEVADLDNSVGHAIRVCEVTAGGARMLPECAIAELERRRHDLAALVQRLFSQS